MSTVASGDMEVSMAETLAKKKQKKQKSRYVDDLVPRGGTSTHPPPLSPIHNTLPLEIEAEIPCGMCKLFHPNRPCFMTESSENLVEYRKILMTDMGIESLEDRVSLLCACFRFRFMTLPLAFCCRCYRRNSLQTRQHASYHRPTSASRR